MSDQIVRRDPAIQNIPVPSDPEKRIRAAFGPLIVPDIDYATLELDLLARIARQEGS